MLTQRPSLILQAKADQKNADYPGCEKGYMNCRDMACFCNGRVPNQKFIKARVNLLLQEFDDNA